MLMGWSGIRKLGRAVVRELVDAGFAVTIFTRENSTSALPAGVVAKEVDYTSVETLRLALQGEDAVVSTIATVAVGGQRPLVDAAVAAGESASSPRNSESTRDSWAKNRLGISYRARSRR